MPWYHSKPHIWKCSCVCRDFSSLAHINSPKLAEIIRPIAILLSGKFQENHIVGSPDICLGTTPNYIFGNILVFVLL